MKLLVPTNYIIVPPGINGYKNLSRFQKCEREFVKGNGRNVKIFYSDSYEVIKIVKYIRHGRVLTYTRFKLSRKLQELFVGNFLKRKLQFNFVNPEEKIFIFDVNESTKCLDFGFIMGYKKYLFLKLQFIFCQ